jgi:hypothetical protein
MLGYPLAILLLHGLPMFVSLTLPNIELAMLQKVGIVVAGIYYQLFTARHATILRFKIKNPFKVRPRFTYFGFPRPLSGASSGLVARVPGYTTEMY